MLAAVEALAGGLDADQPDRLVADEVGEDADGVGAAADAGDDRVGQPPFLLEHLRARLAADDPLIFADDGREGMRPGDGAEQIMGVGEARRPVAQRLVDRVLEAAAAAFDRDHLGAHQPHPEDVELLPLDVVRAHVDARLQPEQGAGHRGRDAVLAGAGLGDQPRLADALGEHRLGEHLVGLVRAAVEQVLALEIDADAVGAEVAATGQRRRPPGIFDEQVDKLGLECRILLRLEKGRLERLERRHEDLGHEGSRHRRRSGRPSAWHRLAPRRRPQRLEEGLELARVLAPRRGFDARADVERPGADLRGGAAHWPG